MQTEIVQMTPAKAAILLKGNTKNRNANLNHVDFLSEQMSRGKWKLNGQSIVVGKDGTLLDGQHRLMAIVKSESTIETIVCRNVATDAIATIDTGKSRNAGDVFSLNGTKNSNQLASVAKIIYTWNLKKTHQDRGGLKGAEKPTNDKLYQIYLSDSLALDTAIKKAQQKSLKFITRGDCTFALYICASNFGWATVDKFIHFIEEGGDYPKSPTHFLPLFLQSRKASDIQRHRREDLYVFLYCFSKWLENKELSKGAVRPKTITANVEWYEKFKLNQQSTIACM